MQGSSRIARALGAAGAALVLATATATTASAQPTPPPAGWVTTTDAPSEISIALPARPTAASTTAPNVQGRPLPLRQYVATVNSDGVIFSVLDFTGPYDLDEGLRALVAQTGQGGMLTGSRHLTVDGHPVIDGRFTMTLDEMREVVLVRVAVADHHLVIVETVGPPADETTTTGLHRQALATLRLS